MREGRLGVYGSMDVVLHGARDIVVTAIVLESMVLGLSPNDMTTDERGDILHLTATAPTVGMMMTVGQSAILSDDIGHLLSGYA